MKSILTSSPVLSPEALRALATFILGESSADAMEVHIEHVATGVARVARNRIRVNNSGDTLRVDLGAKFGHRAEIGLDVNQLDEASLRQAVAYLDRIAHEQLGDPTPMGMPIPPRKYFPVTTWRDATADAFSEARHTVIPTLVTPFLEKQLISAAFVGVYLRSVVYANKSGLMAAGQETDVELTVTGWNANGKGSGWAGQATRDWTTVRAASVAEEARRITLLAANPVAFEPGRRVAILDRPAVAQLVRKIGGDFDASSTFAGMTPMYNRVTRRPKLGERVADPRITLSSDPNDPEGGFLPFNSSAYPLVPMRWVHEGVLENLAYDWYLAAAEGITPSNDPPASLRMSGGHTSIDEMIANCKEGIYVNRFSHLQGAGSDPTSGLVTGVTSGGCLLVRNGKIVKSIKSLRFIASPWAFFNQLEAIGPSERTAFGYAPWQGDWPIPPTIVPPLMVRDFNFVALADNV